MSHRPAFARKSFLGEFAGWQPLGSVGSGKVLRRRSPMLRPALPWKSQAGPLFTVRGSRIDSLQGTAVRRMLAAIVCPTASWGRRVSLYQALGDDSGPTKEIRDEREGRFGRGWIPLGTPTCGSDEGMRGLWFDQLLQEPARVLLPLMAAAAAAGSLLALLRGLLRHTMVLLIILAVLLVVIAVRDPTLLGHVSETLRP